MTKPSINIGGDIWRQWRQISIGFLRNFSPALRPFSHLGDGDERFERRRRIAPGAKDQ